MEGLIHGRAYFRNFTVVSVNVALDIRDLKLKDDETIVKTLLTKWILHRYNFYRVYLIGLAHFLNVGD